jgi:hypothetical protein
LVILGFVVKGGSGGAGSIYIKVDNGYELEELHNVSDAAKTSVVDNDAFLLRDSADNNLWKRLTWSNLKAAVKTYIDTFKGVAGGYASLDGSGKVPASELPSYVDDVIEVANYAALPVTGETGKIYITLDNNKSYRWSGSIYVEIAGTPAWGAITGTLSNQTDLQNALNAKQNSLTFDSTPTNGSTNPVTSDGVFDALALKQDTLTNPVTGTGVSGQVSYWSGTNTQAGSNNLFWDAANNRLSVGTNASIAARLGIRGSGTTSATTALLVQNSTPTELFRIRDDGRIIMATGASPDIVLGTNSDVRFGPSNFGDNFASAGRGFMFALAGSTSTGNGFTIYGGGGTINSGNFILFNIRDNGFTPTSGTATFIQQQLTGTINQTGGANGITRGLYVNPTLTSAVDWRGIESVAASNANHTLLKLRNATVDVFTVKADSKIGFFNATPVVQPTGDIPTALSNLGLVSSPLLYKSATATLTTAGWSLVSGVYEQSLSDANITTSSVVDIIPDNSAASVVSAAQILPRTDSSSGAVKVYATNLPTANIGVTLNIWN